MNALVLSLVLALPWGGVVQDQKSDSAAQANPDAALIAFQKPCYPLKTCPVSGDELGPKAVDFVIDKRLVRLCCDDCKAKVEAKKADIFAAIDKGVIEAQKANYPLEKCPISGEALGSMGEPLDRVVDMRLVRLCCKGCIGKLEKDPAAVLGKLERAYIASQKASYKVTQCPVSGDKLEEGKAVDVLYGTTLIRLCCDDCKKTLARAPQRVANRLEHLKAGKPFEDAEGKEKPKGEGKKKEGG